MTGGKKVVVVMPAYNAENTLRRTWEELPHDIVDDAVLVDDASRDSTVAMARELGIHPDHQYSPRLVTAMAAMIVSGQYDVVLGSRILGGTAIEGGMPLYKYIANRSLTFVENLALGAKLSEYHTGFRAYSRQVLETIPLSANSDDFVFDNEILAHAAYFGFRIGEISCPTRYFDDASSINFPRSVRYGIGVLATSLKFLLRKAGVSRPSIFETGPKV